MLTALVVAGALQAGLTPVADRELVWLLDGVELEIVGVEVADGADLFFSGGRYMHAGRARAEGRWRVERGRLCYRLGTGRSAEGCYAISVDPQGRLYRIPEPAITGGRMEEIRFVPLTTDRL